ncbi:MAG: autotransporter-associated beta strand repeat-containing protein [Verrucomicrobiales bacterium]
MTYNVGSQAVINGNLSLGNATRTFTINDGAALNDLVINAVISGGGASGALIKGNNAGTLVLNNANTYTNGTTSGRCPRPRQQGLAWHRHSDFQHCQQHPAGRRHGSDRRQCHRQHLGSQQCGEQCHHAWGTS